MRIAANDEHRIESTADEVREALGCTKFPIDPLAIALIEGIHLAPGDYDGCFDGRIQYLINRKEFILFYRDGKSGVNLGRVRFSIAHELGHYYLPEHRKRLIAGDVHNSASGFVSAELQEREADMFAAALLMPRRLFAEAVRRHSGQFCTLAEIAQLADHVCLTSLTSAALRYAQVSMEPCCVVFSLNGVVRYSRASEDFRATGLGWLAPGSAIPRGSKSEALATLQGSIARDEGPADCETWFGRSDQGAGLWEDAMALGTAGQVLTLLTIEE